MQPRGKTDIRKLIEHDQLVKRLEESIIEPCCPMAADMYQRLHFETLLTDLSSKFVNVPAGKVDAQRVPPRCAKSGGTRGRVRARRVEHSVTGTSLPPGRTSPRP